MTHYFGGIFSTNGTREADLPDWIRSGFSGDDLLVVSGPDLQHACMQMKTGRSPGLDSLTVEVLRSLDEASFSSLACLCTERLAHGWPIGDAHLNYMHDTIWYDIVAPCLPKINKVVSPNKLRGISLLSTIRKCLSVAPV